MRTITLTWHEMIQGATVGVRRQVEALRRRRPEIYGHPENGEWDAHILGACAEMAVAKHLGAYWEGVVDRPETLRGDVGTVQVRSTTHRGGSLILHDRDKDDAMFYLVVASPPEFAIVGWIVGRDGKVPGFFDASKPRPAYFVPQSALKGT
jgi:hypothetical protein